MLSGKGYKEPDILFGELAQADNLSHYITVYIPVRLSKKKYGYVETVVSMGRIDDYLREYRETGVRFVDEDKYILLREELPEDVSSTILERLFYTYIEPLASDEERKWRLTMTNVRRSWE